jgi:hypothetical protein
MLMTFEDLIPPFTAFVTSRQSEELLTTLTLFTNIA